MAALSIYAQDVAIRYRWPGFRTVMASSRWGVWRGRLTPLSRTYEVQVSYWRPRDDDPYVMRHAWFPEVTILDPRLKRRPSAPDEAIPHIYTTDGAAFPVLCLFDPRDFGWGSHQTIADTILPWAAGWLRFYEIWHATGVWHGGGADHARLVRGVADRGPMGRTAIPRRLLIAHAAPDAMEEYLRQAVRRAGAWTAGPDPHPALGLAA